MITNDLLISGIRTEALQAAALASYYYVFAGFWACPAEKVICYTFV